MARAWCFSCGAQIPDGGSSLAALCARCQQSGRQVPRAQLRWVIRTQDGGSRGPLSHDAVVDQLVRGALDPYDRVARVGGDWRRLCEHADFRRHFLPGSPEAARLLEDQHADRQQKSAYTARRRLKVGGSVALAAASIGLAYVSVDRGLLVVPEPAVSAATGWFADAKESIGGRIETAVSADKAMEAALARREIPGDALIQALQDKWAGAPGPASLHLARGTVALWEGTRGSAIAAREHFEKALAQSPRDPEAASGLARATARLAYEDPSLADIASVASARAQALAPESPTDLLARSEVALSSGARDLALDLVTICGDPPDLAGTPSAEVDLGCAVATASLGHRTGSLEVLDERFPGVYPIRLGLAEALLHHRVLGEATRMLRPLTRSHPSESAPWRLLLDASLPVGDWDVAVEAGERIRELDPARLQSRRQLAEVLLKQRGDAKAAAAEYEALLAHPNGKTLADQPRLYTDAAAAALGAGEAERALELAETALKLDPGAPGAVVQQARALQALDRPEQAQSVLRDVDLNRVQGNLGARYHVAAALLFLDYGLARQGVNELRGALESDPSWPPVHLVSAQTKLVVGNLGGAIEDIEKIGFLDKAQEARRSPLQEVWYPQPDWWELRRELEKQLSADARFAARGPASVAVLAWYADMPDRRRLIDRALQDGAEVPAAHAARAQDLLAAGRFEAAYRQTEQVLSSSHDLTYLHAVKGRCLSAMGRVPEARAEFNDATDEPRKIAGVYRLMAEAALEQGDLEEARNRYKEVLKHAPDDLDANRALVELRSADR